MKKILIVIGFITSGLFAYGQENTQYTNTKVLNKVSLATLRNPIINYEIIHLEDGTYGYEIKVNGTLFYRQNNFPGKTTGFIQKSSAEKTAELIIQKLKNRKDVPQISNKVLNQLGYN